MKQNYVDHDLDINLDLDPDDAQLTRDIHCSIQQSVSHCCSFFSHCYIAIHLMSGLKLSGSRSRTIVYTIQIVIQIIFIRVKGIKDTPTSVKCTKKSHKKL